MTRDAITLKDVYQIVERLEDKIDKRLSDMEARQERLEGFNNKALGVLSVVSIFINLAANWVWNKVIHTS